MIFLNSGSGRSRRFQDKFAVRFRTDNTQLTHTFSNFGTGRSHRFQLTYLAVRFRRFFPHNSFNSILRNGSIPFPTLQRFLLYIFSFVTTQFSNCGAQVEFTGSKGKIKDTQKKLQNNQYHIIFFLTGTEEFFCSWRGTSSLAMKRTGTIL